MKRGSIFETDGIPRIQEALPLALQHVVAMIVGCVTPAIIVAGAAGLENKDQVILIQAALVVAALSTLLQLFPIGKKYRIGSGLPIIMGVSFAYVPSMQAIADGYGKKDQGMSSTSDHRNSGIYHRTFPVSHCN